MLLVLKVLNEKVCLKSARFSCCSLYAEYHQVHYEEICRMAVEQPQTLANYSVGTPERERYSNGE